MNKVSRVQILAEADYISQSTLSWQSFWEKENSEFKTVKRCVKNWPCVEELVNIWISMTLNQWDAAWWMWKNGDLSKNMSSLRFTWCRASVIDKNSHRKIIVILINTIRPNCVWPSWLGLWNTPTSFLQRFKTPKTIVVDVTLNNQMVRIHR